MGKRVLVAMSGGVDSSVAALFLQVVHQMIGGNRGAVIGFSQNFAYNGHFHVLFLRFLRQMALHLSVSLL